MGGHSKSIGFLEMCGWSIPQVLIQCIVSVVGFFYLKIDNKAERSGEMGSESGILLLKKIKQHSVTEVHMTSMVRWTNYKKRHSRLHLMYQM